MFQNIYNDLSDPTTSDYNDEAIDNSIRNILLTPKGTMPGKPTFGSDLTKLLFEQIDHVTIDLIKTFVLNSLVEWEPRISVTGINVKDYPEYNKIVIELEYYYIYYESRRTKTTSITIFI